MAWCRCYCLSVALADCRCTRGIPIDRVSTHGFIDRWSPMQLVLLICEIWYSVCYCENLCLRHLYSEIKYSFYRYIQFFKAWNLINRNFPSPVYAPNAPIKALHSSNFPGDFPNWQYSTAIAATGSLQSEPSERNEGNTSLSQFCVRSTVIIIIVVVNSVLVSAPLATWWYQSAYRTWQTLQNSFRWIATDWW